MSKKIHVILAYIIIAITFTGLMYYGLNENLAKLQREGRIVELFDNPTVFSHVGISRWGKEFTSIKQAQDMLGYTLMTPKQTFGRKLQKIYVQKTAPKESKGFIAVYDGLRFQGFPLSDTPEHAEALIDDSIRQSDGKLYKVTAHGNPGMAANPNEYMSNGTLFRNPASVSWWEYGVSYTVVAKELSVDELITICDSARYNYWALPEKPPLP